MNFQQIARNKFHVPEGTLIARFTTAPLGNQNYTDCIEVSEAADIDGATLLTAMRCAIDHVAMVQRAIDSMQACIDAGSV